MNLNHLTVPNYTALQTILMKQPDAMWHKHGTVYIVRWWA